MRQCPRCSSKFSEDLNYCRLCGAELPKVVEKPPAPVVTDIPPPLPKEEAKVEMVVPPKISVSAPVQEEPPPAPKPQPKREPAQKPPGRQCARCASPKVIPNVTVQADVNGSKGKLQVYVDAIPNALVFKERRRADILADVCGECGYVALRVQDPAGLYYHYLTSRKPR